MTPPNLYLWEVCYVFPNTPERLPPVFMEARSVNPATAIERTLRFLGTRQREEILFLTVRRLQ